MLRIGICDDEKKAREALEFCLLALLHEKDNDLSIQEFSNGEEVLSFIVKHPGELDILFLDIEMPGLNGMETAKRIRKKDLELILIFVTGYGDYVFQGYQVDALDYVMKPVKRDKLSRVLKRALGKLHLMENEVFLIQSKEGMFRIPKRQILYFYSDRRKVTAVTRGREYSYYGKLDEAENELGNGFVRIHQRYLVQAQAVDHVEDGQVVLGEARLPISRSYRQEAMLAFVKAMLT